MKNNEKKKIKNTDRVISSIERNMRNEINYGIPSDVLGSYTGLTADNDYPVQDADDL